MGLENSGRVGRRTAFFDPQPALFVYILRASRHPNTPAVRGTASDFDDSPWLSLRHSTSARIGHQPPLGRSWPDALGRRSFLDRVCASATCFEPPNRANGTACAAPGKTLDGSF